MRCTLELLDEGENEGNHVHVGSLNAICEMLADTVSLFERVGLHLRACRL